MSAPLYEVCGMCEGSGAYARPDGKTVFCRFCRWVSVVASGYTSARLSRVERLEADLAAVLGVMVEECYDEDGDGTVDLTRVAGWCHPLSDEVYETVEAAARGFVEHARGRAALDAEEAVSEVGPEG